jgi:transcriptional regulator with GAF, ATPase, and Fis domain
MTFNEPRIDPSTPTGEFEFKIRGLLADQVRRERRHSLKKLLGLVEKNIIVDVLYRVNGNQRAAGRILGLKSTTLSAKLKRYGIQVIRRFGTHY